MAKHKLGIRSKIKERAEKRQTRSGGIDFVRPPDGIKFFEIKPNKAKETTFDILPFRVTTEGHPEEIQLGGYWFRQPYRMHRNIGPEEIRVTCPKSFAIPGVRCPICEEVARLRKDYNANKDMITALQASDRDLYWVRDPNGDEDSLSILDISKFCFGGMLDSELLAQGDEVADFCELEGGKVVRTRWTHVKKGAYEYDQAERIDFDARKEDYDEALLEDLVDLGTLLQVKTYEELKALLFGVDPEDIGDHGTGEEKGEPKRVSKFTRVVKPEKEETEQTPTEEKEEEGEEDVVVIEEEEKEEEKPAPRTRVSRRKQEETKEEKEEGGDNECPAAGEGGKFGYGCTKYDECDNCKMFAACYKQQRALKKEGKLK